MSRIMAVPLSRKPQVDREESKRPVGPDKTLFQMYGHQCTGVDVDYW